jgi:hypothetical protein
MTRPVSMLIPGLLRRTVVLGCALCAAAAAGCSPAEDPPPAGDRPIPADQPAVDGEAAPGRAGILFSPDTLAAGARIGELLLDSARASDPAAGRDAGSAFFTGEIPLSGRTVAHPDADAAERSVCFEPDPPSAARLPRWEGDQRRIWFCFENHVEAARTLAPPGRPVEALIVIDRYTIQYGASDEVNTARLAWVVERTRGRPGG